MISNNLLTATRTPAQPELAEHDGAALATAEQWLADPCFAALKPQLQMMRARLETFVRRRRASAEK